MTDKMRIWDAVSRTNPSNTKRVNQRGGFTSICAQSQIMEATRAFGPIGEGWGYDAGHPVFHDSLVFIPVQMWQGTRENIYGPVFGGAEWKSSKGHLDSDALKKATTDAVTKLLSQLGFNADVFLGLYDDSKYVAEVTKDFARSPEPKAEAPTGPINDTTRDWLAAQILGHGQNITAFCKEHRIASLKDVFYENLPEMRKWLSDNKQENKA